MTAVPTRCLQCGAEVAPALLACPSCGRLVHADRLSALAACAEHLGWRFDGGGASFVALITTAVVEG